MTPLLDARGVAIPGRLHAADLKLKSGTLAALIGPNGGGKTSLLRALAAIDDSVGEVLIDGEPLRSSGPARRSRMLALVPASRDLPWPIRARDLIVLGAAKPSEAAIAEMIAAFELERILDRPVNLLSTGERSRVLLARALAAEARLLLLDEPLANLDPYWVIRTRALLRRVAEQGHGVLVSVHDLAQLDGFDRVLLVAGSRLIGDAAVEEMIRSDLLSQAFRLRRSDGGWVLNR